MIHLHKYKVFGLKILSEPELPELPLADFDICDVEIKFNEVPLEIQDHKGKGVLYQAKPGKFLFRLESVGAYYVEDGKRINLQRLNNSTDEELRLFLLGSAFGALIHQRKLLAFHGSTVVKDTKALIIAGISGTGKSSLAATLVKRGYSLLADDISVIGFENGKPLVYPGIPHLKLWKDVLIKLGENPDKHDKVRPQILKYRKQVKNSYAAKPLLVEKIIILSSKNTEGFDKTEIKGIDKFNTLKNNTYRFQYVDALGLSAEHFDLCSRLANCVEVVQIMRPSSPLLLEELADFVL
jgi:hypothetical protein